MKKMWMACAMLAMLCGCAQMQPTWETVDDSLALAAGSFLDNAYVMEFDVPVEAEKSSSGSRSVWAEENGDYEIACETVLSSDVEAVIAELSGFPAEQLQIVQTTRYAMPEYQFAWYTSGDEGGRLCRADVLTDGTYCYALCFSCREELAREYDTTAQTVFATFRLQGSEGF